MKAVLLLCVVALTTLAAADVERGEAASTTLGYYRVYACTYDCASGCSVGGVAGHAMETSGGEYGGFLHDDCYAGGNCNAHTCDNETFHPEIKMDTPSRERYIERLHAVQEAAAQGNVSAAVQLLTHYSEHIEPAHVLEAIQYRALDRRSVAPTEG
jgi:hypothetical protein